MLLVTKIIDFFSSVEGKVADIQSKDTTFKKTLGYNCLILILGEIATLASVSKNSSMFSADMMARNAYHLLRN